MCLVDSICNGLEHGWELHCRYLTPSVCFWSCLTGQSWCSLSPFGELVTGSCRSHPVSALPCHLSFPRLWKFQRWDSGLASHRRELPISRGRCPYPISGLPWSPGRDFTCGEVVGAMPAQTHYWTKYFETKGLKYIWHLDKNYHLCSVVPTAGSILFGSIEMKPRSP